MAGKIDVTKALELRMKKGLSFSEIGKYFNCSKQSVQVALKRFNNLYLDVGELEAYRGGKADVLESVEVALLNDLTDTKRREKASLNNTAYALAQVSNMTRLEKGQSTTNIAYRDMTTDLESLQRQRLQLEEALNEY